MLRQHIHLFHTLGFALFVMILAACSSSKFIPEKQYLLDRVEIHSDDKTFNAKQLESLIRQRANSRWFSLFKIPLGTYSLAGKDSTKWINRTLKRIGEEPVIYDTVQAQKTCDDLLMAMKNMGYMQSSVSIDTRVKGKKLTAIYTLHPRKPYYVKSIRYDIADSLIASILEKDYLKTDRIKEGTQFSVNDRDEERKRITATLVDQGYYHFNKDFITYSADSVKDDKGIDLTLHLHPYRANNNDTEHPHPQYRIRNVNFTGNADGTLPLRRSVLDNNCRIEPGKLFSATDLQNTYNYLGRLSAVKYTNIHFHEVDDHQLDCDVQVGTTKPNSISFQPEGTNTAGDLGAAATLTYQNRNIFHGSELFSLELRAAFEAITGLEGYQNQDYEEYGVKASLAFPKFMAPFLSRSFTRNSHGSSELSLAYNLQNRPEFHRRVFSAAWRYKWSEPHHHSSYKLDLIDLNYVYMPWISPTFKHDYLDDTNNRNAILRYNYENLFIMKIGFGVTYNNGTQALKANIETAGNLLGGLANACHFKRNDNNQHTLFNIAYAQYVKADFDYTHLVKFDNRNELALHAGFGIAYPYGNSTVLPFEKRYFSGGANSVRGWNVRELGPGRFRGTDGRIDFINQTGDMKLDLNMELRTKLFWKFNGALFLDAGNIWTIRNYADQPGGQFHFDEFYKQIAVAYGLGIRLNFDYFIVRFDMGMKAVNPAYENSKEHFPIIHPDMSRDFAFHFAVGLPF